MNIFKRSYISVWANKGRTILLFIVFLITMLAFTTKFIVEGVYEELISEAFSDGSIPIEVWVVPEISFGNGMSADTQIITEEMFEKFSKLDMVSKTEKDYSSAFFSKDYKLPYSSDETSFVSFVDDVEDAATEGYTYDYDAELYSSLNNAIIVNDKFLEINNLTVGDTLTYDLNVVEYSSETFDIDELRNKEYIIVGTYTFEPTQEMIDEEIEWAKTYGGDPDLNFSIYLCDLYMPKVAAMEIEEVLLSEGYNLDDSILWVTKIVYLNELSSLQKFETEAEKITGFDIETDIFMFGTGEAELTDAQKTATNISWAILIINVFLSLIVIVVTILMTIISILSVRSRRKELGILIALGERRIRVYFQLVIEQLLIVVLTIVISYPLIYIQIKNYAINNEIGEIPFVISPLIPTIYTGIGLVLLSTLIPAIYTLRLKPKDILL